MIVKQNHSGYPSILRAIALAAIIGLGFSGNALSQDEDGEQSSSAQSSQSDSDQSQSDDSGSAEGESSEDNGSAEDASGQTGSEANESDDSGASQSGSDTQGDQADAAPEDKTLQPHPASILPRAAYELLLDVKPRGDEGFVAVGARGNLLLSPDGMKWDQKKVPTRAMLTAVDFVTAKKGWAVGHAATIIATEDGGETWTLQNFEPELENPFLDVAFFDDQTGFAIGAYDLFYKTTDGGQSWQEYEEPLSVGEWHLNSITRLGDGTMIIAGETGLLSKSTDGGETWNLIKGPYTGSYFGVKALGEKGVLLYGLRGHAFLTEDITQVPTRPNDTDLGYQFKKPPTMSDSGGSGGSDDADATEESEKVVAESAESKKAALAEAERKAAEEEAQKSAWTVIKNNNSVLSLFGATTTKNGGYVITGINGVIWAADDLSGEVKLLPNTQDGGISAVTETKDGDLILVGEAGAYLYKRSK